MLLYSLAKVQTSIAKVQKALAKVQGISFADGANGLAKVQG